MAATTMITKSANSSTTNKVNDQITMIGMGQPSSLKKKILSASSVSVPEALLNHRKR